MLETLGSSRDMQAGRSPRYGDADSLPHSLPESEEAVRGLKASLSVDAAFHAEGFPPPSGGLAAVLATHVQSATKAIPIRDLRHMTPGSGLLGTSAAAGVSLYLATLTPQQREAAKTGINPLDPAAMQKFAAGLGNVGGLGGSARGGASYGDGGSGSGRGGTSGQGASSGARYDSIPGGDWSSPKGMAITRGYAMSHDMGWATKEPDLMRMGQPAIKALHDTHLRGDGYNLLHKPEHMNFDNPTIVSGANFMRRHNLNYNAAANAAGAVYHDSAMTPEERSKWQAAVGGVLRSKPGAPDVQARGNLHDTGEALKKAHPDMAPKVDRALERFNAAQGAANRADASADQKGADTVGKEVKATGKESISEGKEKAVSDKSSKVSDNSDFINGPEPASSPPSSDKPKGTPPVVKSASNDMQKNSKTPDDKPAATDKPAEPKKQASAAPKVAAPSVA